MEGWEQSWWGFTLLSILLLLLLVLCAIPFAEVTALLQRCQMDVQRPIGSSALVFPATLIPYELLGLLCVWFTWVVDAQYVGLMLAFTFAIALSTAFAFSSVVLAASLSRRRGAAPLNPAWVRWGHILSIAVNGISLVIFPSAVVGIALVVNNPSLEPGFWTILVNGGICCCALPALLMVAINTHDIRKHLRELADLPGNSQ